MAIKRDKRDDVFSKLVRIRSSWKCDTCKKQYGPGQQGLHCSHIFGRRSRATRWHPDNAIAQCYSCHQHYTANPILFAEYVVGRFGMELVDKIKFYHGLHIKLTKADLEDIHQDFKAQLKTAKPGDDIVLPTIIQLAIDKEVKRRVSSIPFKGKVK